MHDILQKTDEEVLEIVRQLRTAYQLKRTLRYDTTRDHQVHSESVAEHVFALHYLAEYFMLVEILPGQLSREKVHRIITFHDFGEIPGGDKPYISKTAEDEKQEREDARAVFAALPPELRQLAQDSWEEYERRDTLEGLFVNALDKIEPCFELHDPVNELTLRRLRYTYKVHTGRKILATADFPVMRKFVLATASDKMARNMFWQD
jgi:5'-deoxynucleotidase YfbR-like HD superfamily hydrolase